MDGDAPERFAAHVARVVPALASRCNRWVTINEPNIVALMGWIAGAYPPGKQMAVADAFTVLDSLLTGHVLAYRAIHEVQPGAMVTVNTSSSSLYEHDRMLTDLLTARAAGVDRQDVDAWIDERRSVHDGLFPPDGAGESLMRRLFAAASPYGSPDRRRSALDGLVRSRLRPTPRRVLDAVYEGPHTRPIDACGFDWYDPVASHATRLPGHLTSGGRHWEPSRAIWDVVPDPGGFTRWCGDQSDLLPGLPLWVVENGLCNRVRNGRSYPRPRRLEPAPVPPRARGRGGRRRRRGNAGDRLSPLVVGRQLRVGQLRAEVRNLRPGPLRGPRGFRWLDTDAEGRDSAGAYRQLISWARQGAEGPPPSV